MQLERKVSPEVVVVAVVTLLGWATTWGMLVERERDHDARIRRIEQQVCVLLADDAKDKAMCIGEP